MKIEKCYKNDVYYMNQAGKVIEKVCRSCQALKPAVSFVKGGGVAKINGEYQIDGEKYTRLWYVVTKSIEVVAKAVRRKDTEYRIKTYSSYWRPCRLGRKRCLHYNANVG